MSEILHCIDAGSENCPCLLAVTGDCLTCSRLQGKDYCDCHWRGVCIYNEFMQSNGRVNNPRKEFEADIVETKFYKEDLVVFILDVEKGFAMKASVPGTYLFIKGRNLNHYYDVPISVMKSDIEKGQIHLAIKIISSKTKALLQEKEKFLIRGPYRNGIQGISGIIKKRAKDQKMLIIAKGIGIAPGMLANHFFHGRQLVDLLIDTEKISKDLAGDYLNYDADDDDKDRKESGKVRFISLNESQTLNEIETLLKEKQYDNVMILVSDYYIDILGRLVKKCLPEADIAVSNNFRMCCGEGLCGSCSLEVPGGGTIKMCKCQLQGEEILEKRPLSF